MERGAPVGPVCFQPGQRGRGLPDRVYQKGHEIFQDRAVSDLCGVEGIFDPNSSETSLTELGFEIRAGWVAEGGARASWSRSAHRRGHC